MNILATRQGFVVIESASQSLRMFKTVMRRRVPHISHDGLIFKVPGPTDPGPMGRPTDGHSDISTGITTVESYYKNLSDMDIASVTFEE